ncbi:uncharacterized protein PODANS_1_14440 [Podospora anserina S mat+]|uniref:Podospora anserina S mat+ genomic DNA chromosome 1, supercontig 4 n=1 Tax=Podospora anserina (strain S / ATCC MYA-4624 / DSM 980 / FGSC 10383) TaxID=515849 RepID=B2AT24_PODAN|nr:uncharacterized protein PODANS_1_14440 [Podospora anserina S mat+]CAP67547.1 unnamed protein product [Podospora anserina S mat+]CDP23808.1 Putative protein of unknown function [Podospora anserina S mat+]
MRLEHPWYSKYWAPRPYTRTPQKATRETPRVTPPSRRRSPPDQGFLNRGTAQQQHGGTSSLGSPSGRKKVGQPSISPEYMRGPPPGFPPISQPQAGLQPSPPRMQPHPVGATEYNLDYHGPAHRQPCVPFHHQMAEIPEKPQNHGNLPPAHHFNQSFQQHGPPQWHHGPPHWQHAHPLPPPPPPHLPPFFDPANFVGPIPQPPYQAPPVFYNQGGPHGNAQCPVDPQMRSPQARTRQSPEQDMVGSQPLSHSSSSSSAHTTHAISQVWVVVDKAAAAEHTNKGRPVKAGTSPDEPSTPIDTVSTQGDGRVAGTLEKPVQEGESSDQGGTVVRHAQFSIHDVRFSQDMSGTARIRPNRRNQHQALPAEWLAVDSRSATPAEQRQPSGSKKGKNKRKPGARPSSRPSTPVDFSSSQAESSRAQASASTERPESVTENAALKVPEPKGYRADAGGSLKLSWNPRGPAIRVNHLADQMLPPPLRTGSPQEGPSTGPVLKGNNSKQARFQRFDSLSSIPDCPVLPRACDLFPNYPDLSTSPPKIVMTPAKTTPNEEMASHPTINGLLNGPNRGISDSSLAQSFYTAKSTFSSRENSPPEAAKDELFVSPPETPTKTSQPSSRTLPAHPSLKLTAAAPVLEVPVETPKLDKGKSTAPLQPETSVSNLETSEPSDSKPEAPKPKSSSKNKHKKKNKTRADTEAGPSSSQPQEQQQQLPTPVGSKPNSRPATPVGDANVRNQKKRQAHAKSKAERKRSAAAASANKGGPSSSGADA